MASSYFTESEAPRDFRVSSTESDGHYKKCLLCYTVKKNFYCPDCIRAGNFVHSSMPYADRYAEKQAKLLRLKVNRKHILDRCEKLLSGKLKKDKLLTEAKQSRDKLDLLRLAIEQRRTQIEKKRKDLLDLRSHNNELSLKLPKYQKRVSSVGKHLQMQRMELQNKISTYTEQAETLAALRRARIRQLTNYIFPVYMSYDVSDSIEDMEFIGSEEEEPPRRPHLHIVAPWINTDGDFAQIQSWPVEEAERMCEGGVSGGAGGAGDAGGAGGAGGAARVTAALCLCAQVLSLLAWLLDVRLPYILDINEYSNWRISESAARRRAARAAACGAALCVRAGLSPATGCTTAGAAGTVGTAGTTALAHTVTQHAPHALVALHALVLAASTDEPMLGRVESYMESVCESAWGGAEMCAEDDEPPEHLSWPDTNEQIEEITAPSPPIAPSLVTSAAASIASMWRVFTK